MKETDMQDILESIDINVYKTNDTPRRKLKTIFEILEYHTNIDFHDQIKALELNEP